MALLYAFIYNVSLDVGILRCTETNRLFQQKIHRFANITFVRILYNSNKIMIAQKDKDRHTFSLRPKRMLLSSADHFF